LESEWRWNLGVLSMWWSPWQLAARVVGTVAIPIYVVKENNTQWGTWVNHPIFGSLPARLTGPTTIGPTDRFPYGIDVLPD